MANTTALVILFPLMLTMLWIGVSAAMFFYARTAALTAAETGAAAGAAMHGTTGSCVSAAEGFARRVGDTLTGARVACVISATEVRVTVTGSSLSLVPGWAPTVSQTAIQPRERLTR